MSYYTDNKFKMGILVHIPSFVIIDIWFHSKEWNFAYVLSSGYDCSYHTSSFDTYTRMTLLQHWNNNIIDNTFRFMQPWFLIVCEIAIRTSMSLIESLISFNISWHFVWSMLVVFLLNKSFTESLDFSTLIIFLR